MLLCVGGAIPMCGRQARKSCLTFFARWPVKPAALTAHPQFARGSRCGGKVRASDYRSPLRGRLDAPRRLRTTLGYVPLRGWSAKKCAQRMFSATAAKMSPTPSFIPKHKLQRNLNPRNGHIPCVGGSLLVHSYSKSWVKSDFSAFVTPVQVF